MLLYLILVIRSVCAQDIRHAQNRVLSVLNNASTKYSLAAAYMHDVYFEPEPDDVEKIDKALLNGEVEGKVAGTLRRKGQEMKPEELARFKMTPVRERVNDDAILDLVDLSFLRVHS